MEGERQGVQDTQDLLILQSEEQAFTGQAGQLLSFPAALLQSSGNS